MKSSDVPIPASAAADRDHIDSCIWNAAYTICKKAFPKTGAEDLERRTLHVYDQIRDKCRKEIEQACRRNAEKEVGKMKQNEVYNIELSISFRYSTQITAGTKEEAMQKGRQAYKNAEEADLKVSSYRYRLTDRYGRLIDQDGSGIKA